MTQYVPLNLLDLGSGGLDFRNAIINGACRVAQYGTKTVSSNATLYGGVDRIYLNTSGFSTVSGSLFQDGNVGTRSTFAQHTTLTTTGSGTVSFGTRLEAKDVQRFAGKTVSVSARVQQDTGASLNVTLALVKPTAVDNYASGTTLYTSSATSVVTSTWVDVSATFTLSAADVVNGLQVALFFNGVGAVSAKNFYFGDFQLVEGSVALPIDVPPYAFDEAQCMRYYEAGTCGQAINPLAIAGTVSYTHAFKVRKRATPTCTVGVGAFQVQTVDGFSCYQGAIGIGAWYNPTTFSANAEL